MRISFLFAFPVLALALVSCKPKQNKAVQVQDDPILTDTVIVDSDQYVKFETTKGTFVVKLFRETPLHRHNMAIHAKYGKYDGQLFFGVQKNFKVQCGDLTSRGKAPKVVLGVEDKPDTIRGEIDLKKFYHRRGAVAQASMHQTDYSTSQQFYIVTGVKVKPADVMKNLTAINKRFHKVVKDSITRPYSPLIREYRDKKLNNKLSVLNDRLTKQADSIIAARGGRFEYSQAQLDDYANVGGTPSLDGYYTVFGQVVEGMDVIDSISMSKTDINYRPVPDVRIIKATLLDTY